MGSEDVVVNRLANDRSCALRAMRELSGADALPCVWTILNITKDSEDGDSIVTHQLTSFRVFDRIGWTDFRIC